MSLCVSATLREEQENDLVALTETELAKIKKATYALMCQDRQKLLVRFPFTGGFMMRMELVPVRDCRLRTAATDGERILSGTIPVHLESVVRAALRPHVRWQEVLSQFVTSCYGGSRRWLPPNRRHISRGLYLQSSRKERLQAVVAIDTSGSTTADLPQFFSELTSFLNTFGDYELTVIQCDCKIQHVEKIDALINSIHRIGKRSVMAERTFVLCSFMLRSILKSSRRALSTSPMATAPHRTIRRLIRFFGF